ncbi:MAG: DUF1643 domain-containing protein [Bacteroidota bacterium]
MLWRIWDIRLPRVLFIGLNPSIANATTDDPTTKRILGHAKRLGFGGFYLANCFSNIATNPKLLHPTGNWQENLRWISHAEKQCNEVVFAWGKHPLVKKLARAQFFIERFPNAKQLGKNRDGSPKHPLYLPYSGKLHPYCRDAP